MKPAGRVRGRKDTADSSRALGRGSRVGAALLWCWLWQPCARSRHYPVYSISSSAAADSPIGTSESSESSGLDPAHREDLNSTYFFTHRRGSFCRAAIRDRRSSTYSWAIARNPEMTWLVRRSLMQTISSWQRMTCPPDGNLDQPGLRRQLIVENNAKPHPFRDRGYHPLATADLNDLVQRHGGCIDQPVYRRSALAS